MTATATRPAKPEQPVKATAFRGQRADVPSDAVIVCDREGGRFGAGLIPGVSLITTGEALGHEYWIDDVAIAQVAKLGSENDTKGLKCRFTHPGMSSDGLGKLLGRIHDIRADGNRVIGDLHIVKLAHDTPDGDLANYAMDLVDEQADAAGLSIVFNHDFAAEDEFMNKNLHEVTYPDGAGRAVTRKVFQSPDQDNVHNYPHIRLQSLEASDLVDSPAANPSGLFSRQTLPREADEFLSFISGISDKKPETSCFGIESSRAQDFLGRWLDSHGLSLVLKEPILATEQTEPVAQTREDYNAELATFTAKFGSENGAKWFSEGMEFAEALAAHCDALSERLEAEIAAREEVEGKLSSLQLGETEPIATGVTDPAQKKPATFAEAASHRPEKS